MLFAGLLLDMHPSSLPRLTAAGPLQFLAERLLHLYGTPAVQALAFLRDLLVCSVVLVGAKRLLGRYLAALLPALCAISLFGTLEPVVARPNILLFMTIGVALRQHALALAASRRCRAPLLFAFCLVVLARFGVERGVLDLTGAFGRLEDLILRAVLVLVFLDLSTMLVRSAVSEWLLGWEPHAFLAYLSHTSVISALWLLWNRAGGGVELPAYGAFFLLAPVAAFVAARMAAPAIAGLPGPAQILILGKAARRVDPALQSGPKEAATGPV